MLFPFVKQYDAMDCGPACLKMIAGFYKKNFTLDYLRKKCFITKEGVSFLGLSEAADSVGFRTLGVKIPYEMLEKKVTLPCIIHWRQRHFVVLYKIFKDKVWIADPATGLITYSRAEFEKNWTTTMTEGKQTGLALIIEPTPALYDTEDQPEKASGFRFLIKYF